MSNEQSTLSKREALESLLTDGDVLLQLDPRVAGVKVPAEYFDQPLLVLRIGLEMPIPIPDLVINDTGIRATLSFNRTPHPVAVPWKAVFGMVSEHGQGLLWTGDVPPEVVDQMLKLTSGEPPSEADAAPEAERPQLVALDGGRDPDEPPPEPSPGGSAPSLRLIK